MTVDAFNEIVSDAIDEIRRRLVEKGSEYTVDGDRIGHNKKLAAVLGVSTTLATVSEMSKHYITIVELAKKDYFAMRRNQKTDNFDQWYERLFDLICYCIILLAIVSKEENPYE